MSKIKEIFTSWRVLLLIAVLIMAIIAINPNPGAKGIIIDKVEFNSSAAVNKVPEGVKLLSINRKNIENIDDYTSAVSSIKSNEIIIIQTGTGSYSIISEDQNGTINLGISVKEVPTSNIRKGMDLIGGARVILKPNQDITAQQLEDSINLIERRLNVYGISDVLVRPVSDFEGNKFIVVEIAGATREEVSRLVSQQGKFEAKIGNETVFIGGIDIKNVDRKSAGIDINRGCGQIENSDEWTCRFQFRVDVSPQSAEKHMQVTKNLDVIDVNGEQYLSKKLDLYLDDELVDSLYISKNLQGEKSTSFVIQGPGRGNSKNAAMEDALNNMKNLQTVLISGSLPIKLDIEKIDIVSPTLGEKFFESAGIALIAALGAVGALVLIRYRKLKIAIPIVITSFSEIIIILGFAALIKWNIDIAAIAGIIAAVGTGVDHQIVITDEVLRGEKISHDWKRRIKNAFFIIMAAYFTTVVAMVPLWVMGAGLLKGFALTTIAGVSIGVFITRPAFARIIEVLLD